MPAYTNTVTSTHQDFTWTGGPGFFTGISLIPGIEYNAQLEVERKFALDRSGNPTIAAFLGSEFVSTQDKRQVFVIPNQYITYNTTNKSITGFTLSNYNYTYYLTTDLTQSNPLYILVPNISTSVNTLFTVKRKSISNQALVTWADGGKLTSSQLNLQTQQLLFLAQETADRINTELSNATDIAYAIADGAITYTKILGDGVNAWNFNAPIITLSPTSDSHATTRLYTLNSIYNHGVITKDDTAPSSSAVDILETAATAGNSGIWFDPKLGQLQVWAGNAWVALVGVPLSTNNIVDIGSTQTITGAKTFSSTLGVTGAATLSSTLGVTGAVILNNTLNVGAATQLGTTLLVAGAVILNNTLNVGAATQLGTTLLVAGATTFSSTLGVTGATTIQGLTVGKGGGTIVSNTVFGINALAANTTGTANTAVGNTAMSANTTGIQNCAFGSASLSLNTIGYSNIAVGEASLYSNISGYRNTAIGNNALLLNTTGYQNTAVGMNTLYYNTTGVNNSAFGYTALYSNTTGIYNSAFGHAALQSNTTGIYNNAFGYAALASNTTGNYNSAFGFSSGSQLTTGAHNTFIGYNAQGSTATIGNEVSIHNNSITARFQGAATGWTFVSDARDKNNIENLNFGLEFVTQLQPRKFNWNIRNSNVDNGKEASGFIAQELLNVVESQNASCLRLVDTNDPNQFSITQTNLIPVLVKAIQELKAELEAAKLRINQLENIP